MPAKLRKKVQKEARRERREATELGLRNSKAIVIQIFFRFMFVRIPHLIYEHLQYMMMNKTASDMGFFHVTYPCLDKELFKVRFADQVLDRSGWIYYIPKDKVAEYQDILKKRHVTFLQWMLSVSPYAPIKISTMLLTYDLLNDNNTKFPHKDWILYMQASDCYLPTGVSFPTASIGRETLHFYGKRGARLFGKPLLPEVD